MAKWALVVFVLLPSVALAQGSITGVVRDPSGAVLPGVTVEAASPALIEKSRTVVSDGAGQYRIVDLRPGTYAVTFTLTGFNIVKRDGVELSGNFTATVNAEMKVGAMEETVTVSGQPPIVDVQSTSQQRVMSKDVIDAIPTGRRVYDLGVLIPGVTINAMDVGGTGGSGSTTLAIHGSRIIDQRVTLNGLAVTNLDAGGQVAAYNPNLGSSQEVTFDTSGVSAENSLGGVTINIIPKEGGNRFSGTLFGTGVTSGWQGSNLDTDLQSRGFTTPDRIKSMYDVNPGFGGPVLQDKLWFYASGRWNEVINYSGGAYHNANVGKTTLPDSWLYAPDLSRPATTRLYTRSINGRVTSQLDAKDKVSVFWDSQAKCQRCPGATATFSPELAASGGSIWPVERFATVDWSSPRTNRLLLEANLAHRDERYETNKIAGADPNTIVVVEQSTGMTYHGLHAAALAAVFANFNSRNWIGRASMSYVTGSHSIKVGVTDLWGTRTEFKDDTASSTQYRFNLGVPNQITQRATPTPPAT